MFVTTEFGRLRPTTRDLQKAWLFECKCGEWLPITREMFDGVVSINHDADGCLEHYHETHNFSLQPVALTLGDIQAMRNG